MSGWKKGLLFAGDIVILYAALAGALLVRYGTSGFSFAFAGHKGPFLLIFTVFLLVFYLFDLYHLRTFLSSLILFRAVAVAAITAGIVSMGAFYLFPDYFELTPKTNLAMFVGFTVVLSYAWRTLLRVRFKASAIPVVFVGTSPRITELIEEVRRTPHLGYRVAQHYETLKGANGSMLESLANAGNVALLVIDPALAHDARAARQIYRIIPHEVNVIPFAAFYEAVFEKVPLEDLSEEWFIENITARRPVYDRVKRVIDVTLATILFAVTLPLSFLIGIFIVATSRGGALYRAERTGKGGRSFILNKFRTMRNGNGGPLWTEKNDARITPIGTFLRATHLDEFPQLWNIIRGDISFTGPRPENVGLTREYERFSHYEMRHVVKPGLTGWAQINYQPSASLEEAYEKLKYDLYYVKNRSLFLDLLIILKTIRYFFMNHS
ncbi:MAG: exopolysaccharide biosynthesis polyprenyl glycosylphosphotransferase [Candidatus Brennerbacteria bacterium]|nr:exopolysaccharide biosynthesis polyprenyl glycosylphosphotransferase [Candidatus Brennerbacteria bacterium]